jgi:hypothetical protein
VPSSATEVTFDRFATVLANAQLPDGGVGWISGAPAEPEPTALLALALDDHRARSWLAAHQADDGAIVFETGEARNTGAAALNALALPTADARLAALDFALTALGQAVPEMQQPDEPVGWGWLPDTFAWVEPTSRILLATRILRPADRATIDDALKVLRARQVTTGGWNYGNSTVLGTDLTPYAQTTAAACIGMHGLDEPSLQLGLDLLETLSLQERGGLSLAMSAVALRLNGRADEDAQHQIIAALDEQYDRTAFLGNLGAIAWAVLATRPGPSPLEAAP